MVFTNRYEAGKKLIKKLVNYKPESVLAIPRGGLPVAFEIAKYFRVPLNVLVARKIGSPFQPEYGLGAISEDDSMVLDYDRMDSSYISINDLKGIIENEKRELKRRIKLYRKGTKLNIKNKKVIIVDDGLATGVTARAAAIAARKLGAKKIVFATPVCATQNIPILQNCVDKVVYLTKQDNLGAIGNYYQSFEQVGDDEVIRLLNQSTHETTTPT